MLKSTDIFDIAKNNLSGNHYCSYINCANTCLLYTSYIGDLETTSLEEVRIIAVTGEDPDTINDKHKMCIRDRLHVLFLLKKPADSQEHPLTAGYS